MNTVELTPEEAARWALRAGLPLSDERHEAVAATAQHIQSVIATLRELDFGDTAPAAVFIAGNGTAGNGTGGHEIGGHGHVDSAVAGQEHVDAAV